MAAATGFDQGKSERARQREDRRAAHRRLKRLAWLMDSAVRVPGTSIRFGMDSVIGLVPGFGDLASTALSGWFVFEARRLGLPPSALARMVTNVALDLVIGAVPLAGDVADVFWKANRRNLRILEEHLAREDFDEEPVGETIEGSWRRVG